MQLKLTQDKLVFVYLFCEVSEFQIFLRLLLDNSRLMLTKTTELILIALPGW